MCAQYLLEMDPEGLASQLKADLDEVWRDYDSRILPYRLGAVLVWRDGHRVLRSMKYSLVPSWSKEPKVKFATHNARLYSQDEKTHKEIPIYQKPTWKLPFAKYHCVVPISKFIEPIYENEYAGNMVRFFSKEKPLLLAAGIYSEWLNKETGEVIPTYAIITDEPPKFIAKTGHDRCPIFLEDRAIDTWLKADLTPDASCEFLRKSVLRPSYQVEVDRPLKAGWQKRIPN